MELDWTDGTCASPFSTQKHTDEEQSLNDQPQRYVQAPLQEVRNFSTLVYPSSLALSATIIFIAHTENIQ